MPYYVKDKNKQIFILKERKKTKEGSQSVTGYLVAIAAVVVVCVALIGYGMFKGVAKASQKLKDLKNKNPEAYKKTMEAAKLVAAVKTGGGSEVVKSVLKDISSSEIEQAKETAQQQDPKEFAKISNILANQLNKMNNIYSSLYQNAATLSDLLLEFDKNSASYTREQIEAFDRGFEAAANAGNTSISDLKLNITLQNKYLPEFAVALDGIVKQAEQKASEIKNIIEKFQELRPNLPKAQKIDQILKIINTMPYFQSYDAQEKSMVAITLVGLYGT